MILFMIGVGYAAPTFAVQRTEKKATFENFVQAQVNQIVSIQEGVYVLNVGYKVNPVANTYAILNEVRNITRVAQYDYPKNSVKPDNTNLQLIRWKSLHLQSTEYNS